MKRSTIQSSVIALIVGSLAGTAYAGESGDSGAGWCGSTGPRQVGGSIGAALNAVRGLKVNDGAKIPHRAKSSCFDPESGGCGSGGPPVPGGLTLAGQELTVNTTLPKRLDGPPPEPQDSPVFTKDGLKVGDFRIRIEMSPKPFKLKATVSVGEQRSCVPTPTPPLAPGAKPPPGPPPCPPSSVKPSGRPPHEHDNKSGPRPGKGPFERHELPPVKD